MAKYLQKMQDLISGFKSFEISHISQAENAQTNTLFKLATLAIDSLGRTFVEQLEASSIDKSVEAIKWSMNQVGWIQLLTILLMKFRREIPQKLDK